MWPCRSIGQRAGTLRCVLQTSRAELLNEHHVETVIALLGRRDAPTDGVEDYCIWLGRGLAQRGIPLAQVRVPWKEAGWLRALWRLWLESAAWRGRWVPAQYTAMSWSRRGSPLGLRAVL